MARTYEAPAVTGANGIQFEIPLGTVSVVEHAREIDEAITNSSFGERSKDLRYYKLIEEALPDQFGYRYFVLRNASTGDVAVQPFFFVDQDLTAGMPASFAKWMERLRRRWPSFLKMRMLMVGCAAGEGHLPNDAPWVAEALRQALEIHAPRAGAAIILLKDVPSRYRALLSSFCTNGYRRVPSMPGATLDLDFPNFEVYLQQRLSKVYRKNLRRKFKALEEAPRIEMEVTTDGRPYAAELHALYLQTHLRSRLRFERLTPEYFAEIGSRLPDRARFFLWRQSGQIIAFSLCFVHEGTIYDLDVGLDYKLALDLHLYFLTLRDVLQWAVENGVTKYHTGPLNYDPKLHLRMRLSPLDLYARHLSPWINPVFKLALKYLEPTRHDPVLHRFPNADELS